MSYNDQFLKDCKSAGFNPDTQTMKNHTQTLEDFQLTFDNYLELDADDLYVEVGCWVEFHDEHSEEFTDLEHELYWKIDGIIDVANDHFDAIAKQEEDDERREQAQYLASEYQH